MRKIDSKLILRYSIRAFLVVCLAWAGFKAEHLLQSRLTSEELEVSKKSTTPIVLLGGSMATGLGPMIKDRLAPELDGEVVEVTSAMLSSDQVASRTPEIISKYKPKVLLVQVGLNEETSDTTGWESRAIERLRAKDTKSLVEIFGSILAKGKPEERDRLAPFLLRHQDEIRSSDVASALADRVDREVLVLLPKLAAKKETRDRIQNLVVVGRLLEGFKGPGDLQKAMRISPKERAELATKTFRRIVDIAEKWPEELGRLGVTRFVREGDPRQRFVRIWFCTAWEDRNRKTDRDAIEYFIAHPEKVMKVFGWPFHLARDPKTISLLRPQEPRELWDSLFSYRSKNDFEHFNEDTPVEKERTRFSKNIKTALEAARSFDVKIILLQFPNQDLDAVTDVGRELGLPVVQSRKLFKSKIADFGREQLFIDRIGMSGHLTDEGLALYGRFIAEKVNQELGATR